MKRNGYEMIIWWSVADDADVVNVLELPGRMATVPLDRPPSRTPKRPSGSGSRPPRMTARKLRSHAAAGSSPESWLARGEP